MLNFIAIHPTTKTNFIEKPWTTITIMWFLIHFYLLTSKNKPIFYSYITINATHYQLCVNTTAAGIKYFFPTRINQSPPALLSNRSILRCKGHGQLSSSFNLFPASILTFFYYLFHLLKLTIGLEDKRRFVCTFSRRFFYTHYHKSTANFDRTHDAHKVIAILV